MQVPLWKPPLLIRAIMASDLNPLHQWPKYSGKTDIALPHLESIMKRHHGRFLLPVLWTAGQHIPALINFMVSLVVKPISGRRLFTMVSQSLKNKENPVIISQPT